jgi:hypothetical protein
MKMQSFHFDERYAMRRRKNLSFPDAQCPNILKNSSISISLRNEQNRLYTNTRFMAPLAMRGEIFQNLRPKNAKNHAILLLQMQGCPQSNIKKEIKSFCFKIFTKRNNELS